MVMPDSPSPARIKVVGVGGGGGNAVSRMMQAEVRGIEYIAVNTDVQALDAVAADRKMPIGTKVTQGLGAGGNPVQGTKAAEETKLAAFADEFLTEAVSEKERGMIRRIAMNAMRDGKLEAMVYSFPSDLCTDGGRAINNLDPNWPQTLRGKAKELFDRYQTIAKPKGYKLKAQIINFPGGIPGDVGFFLSWAP